MSKGLLTKQNSQFGEIIEYYPNVKTTRHTVHFESDDLKDYWIARYLYNEANYDWKTELENQPEFAFIQNTSTSGVFTIKIDYYRENWGETINSLLNKDTAMIKGEDGLYYLYNLSDAFNEGEKNITYTATLNIAFTYQILNLLKNDILIEKTQAKNNFINLDNQQNVNNIKTNFNKREMFDTTTKETIDNINISSIYIFYSIIDDETEDANPSQNSLYKVKIIPICTGEYYPYGANTVSISYTSTLDALSWIYEQKDSLVKYIMVLSETPYITKHLETDSDGNTIWNGALDINTMYIDYETQNDGKFYIFSLKRHQEIEGVPVITTGNYKLKTNDNTGDYQDKTISFLQTINDNDTYLFDFGVVKNGTEDIDHTYYSIKGSAFPKIGEEKIVWFGGDDNIVYSYPNKYISTTELANSYNSLNYQNGLMGSDDNGKLDLLYPIKIKNLDNINYTFSTPTSNDLYNLTTYNSDFWYMSIQAGGSPPYIDFLDNNTNLWGNTLGVRVDNQFIIKSITNTSISSNSVFNFLYRFDMSNFIKNNEDIHLFQSGLKDLKIGIPNTDLNIKLPINILNNKYIYVVGVLDLYKLTTNYFLLLENYNINSYESNFVIENVQINGPVDSSQYLEWYNGHKTSRMLGRIESGILIAGGGIGFVKSWLNPWKKTSWLGLGVSAGGAFKGLNLLENKKNLQQSPIQTTRGEDFFMNFVQPYNIIDETLPLIKEDKIQNFDFSLYAWEEIPEDNFQENERKNIIVGGIKVSNIVNSPFYFGEKKRFQYFEISQSFENIQASLSTEIKQKIDEIFEKGITFWYFRNDLVFNGIKNYEQDNPFIDEEEVQNGKK